MTTDNTRALMAQIDSLVFQRDAAEALAREATERETTLGLQVVAQAARLRLAGAVCDALRRAEACAAGDRDGFPDYHDAVAALAAWDAVPGMEP